MIAAPATITKGTVLLINPNRLKPGVAPIALDYLAHALSEAGFEAPVLDLCFAPDPQQALRYCLSRNSPLLVAVTLRNTDDTSLMSQDFFLPQLKTTLDTIKARTAAPIALGGAGFSVMPEAILGYFGLDWGIWGEGEYALPLLASKLATGEDYRTVPGLVHRTERGFVRNPPHFMKLEETSAPPRTTIDNPRYYAEGGMGNIETKRGCNRTCVYCVDPVGKGKTVRMRSPQSVADEAEALLEMGVEHLHFCDSEFNIPAEHAEAVCHEFIRRGLGERLRWYTYCSAVPFSPELAHLFRQAGCAGINFGVDSAADKVLKRLSRDYRAEDVARTAQACRSEGLTFIYDLLLGGPGETKGSLKETIDVMKRLSPDRVGISFGVRVFPHTALANLVRKQGPWDKNPNLQGTTLDNESFLAPVFYVSSALGTDPYDYLGQLIGGDERFFFLAAAGTEQNYNYNDNTALVEAIKEGYRGAFWDILRRISAKTNRSS